MYAVVYLKQGVNTRCNRRCKVDKRNQQDKQNKTKQRQEDDVREEGKFPNKREREREREEYNNCRTEMVRRISPLQTRESFTIQSTRGSKSGSLIVWRQLNSKI